MRPESAKSGVIDPYSSAKADVISGRSGFWSSSGVPAFGVGTESGPGPGTVITSRAETVWELPEGAAGSGGAVNAPQAIRAVVTAARRRALSGAGEDTGGTPDGGRAVRRCFEGPVPCSPCSLQARCAACGFCPECMPPGCAPVGPSFRGRRRPCGKCFRGPACGDRNDSGCRRIGLGSGPSPVVASPTQHSADRSGVSGRPARNADFACLHPSASGRPSGRHGRGPGHHGSPR